MLDVATEQIIKVKASRMSIVYKAVMILACVLAATTIPQTGAFGIFVFAVFVVSTFFLFEYYSAEYEYSIVEDVLSVDRIMAKSMRRKCGVYDIGRTTLVAGQGSQDALRMEHMKLRTQDYTSGMDMEGVVVLYTYDDNNNEQVRILLQPNEAILTAIKGIVDKSAYKM